MALKHYVTFLSPGSLFPNEETNEIFSRDEKLNIPENCFAYEFFDRVETEIEGELLKGSPKNKSGRYYLGQVMTLDEVKIKEPSSHILIRNMEMNNWAKVVKTRMGNFQPLLKDDIVISD